MDIMELGAIGELVGGVAVIASLIYVGLQVRHSAQKTRSETLQAIFDAIAVHNNEMFSPANADLFVKGLRGFVGLSASERARFQNLLTNLFNYMEVTYRATEEGLLGPDTMNGWHWYMRKLILPYPGAREWWEQSQGVFPPDIRGWVAEQIEAADLSEDFFGVFREQTTRE